MGLEVDHALEVVVLLVAFYAEVLRYLACFTYSSLETQFTLKSQLVHSLTQISTHFLS